MMWEKGKGGKLRITIKNLCSCQMSLSVQERTLKDLEHLDMFMSNCLGVINGKIIIVGILKNYLNLKLRFV